MNRHHVEQQFMRSFTRQQAIRSLPSLTGDKMTDDEATLFDSMWGEVRSAGGLTGRQMMTSLVLQRSPGVVTGAEPIHARLVSRKPMQIQWNMDSDVIRAEYESVRRMFEAWFSGRRCQVDSSYDRASELEFYGDRIGVHTGRMRRTCLSITAAEFYRLNASASSKLGSMSCYRMVRAKLIGHYWHVSIGTVAAARVLWLDRWMTRYIRGMSHETSKVQHSRRRRKNDLSLSQCIASSVALMAPSSVTVVAAKRPASRSKHAVPVKTPAPVRLFKTCPLPLQIPFW